MSSPCEEYYRQRSSEIATQLAKWTQSAVVRDESFVRLLRAKVERRARLADAVAQVSRNAVAETRHALVANNNRAAAASDRAAAELGQFADGLRRADDDGGEATAAELDEMNARLREVVKLKREAIDHDYKIKKMLIQRRHILIVIYIQITVARYVIYANRN